MMTSKWIMVTMAALLNLRGLPGIAHASPLQADDVGATPVTIHAENDPVTDVLSQITAQSGLNVRGFTQDGTTPAPAISIDADAKPFWAVLSEVCAKSSTRMEFQRDGTIGIFPVGKGVFYHPWPEGIAVAAGPALLIAKNLEHVRDLTVSAERQDFCQLNVQIMLEHRLPLLYYKVSAIPTKAIDDKENSLLPTEPMIDDPRTVVAGPPNQNPDFHLTADYDTWATAHVRLHIPPNAGSRVAELQGAISLWIASKYEHIEIEDFINAKESKRTINGVSMTIAKVRNWRNIYSAEVEFDRDDQAPEVWDPFARMVAETRMELVDANGKHCEHQGSGSGWGPKQRSVGCSFNQPADKGPLKLIIDVPIETKQLDVPYDLMDLPLP